MITLYIIYRCRKFILQQKQKRAECYAGCSVETMLTFPRPLFKILSITLSEHYVWRMFNIKQLMWSVMTGLIF